MLSKARRNRLTLVFGVADNLDGELLRLQHRLSVCFHGRPIFRHPDPNPIMSGHLAASFFSGIFSIGSVGRLPISQQGASRAYFEIVKSGLFCNA